MKRTIEQAKKFAAIKAPNGYTFDEFRFRFGLSHGDEYPSFIKTVSEDDEKTTYKRVYFFRFWDKTSAIFSTTYSMMKNGEKWQVVNANPNYKEEKLADFPKGTRFNVNMLLSYCD